MSTTSSYLNRSTPGVYITEIAAFPTAIVGVPTAIPAFIGYTATAVQNGQSVLLQPVSINSMAEYIEIFGQEPPRKYNIVPFSAQTSAATANPDFTITNSGGSQAYSIVECDNMPSFNLYYSMQLFYANGGGNCYVVSVGNYSSPTAISATDLKNGLNAISFQSGPTMLVVPEAISLPADSTYSGPPPGTNTNQNPATYSTQYASVVQAMLSQAAGLGDRVALLDIWGAAALPSASDPEFTNDMNVLVQNLQAIVLEQQATVSPSYAITYFPFLATTIVPSSDLNYTNFQNDYAFTSPPESPISPISPPDYAGGVDLQDILTQFNISQYQTTNNQIQGYIDGLSEPNPTIPVMTTDQILQNSLTQYSQLISLLATRLGVLPASPAIAGVYTTMDAAVGVYNAPANTAVLTVNAATVSLTDAQQGPLNVPVNGAAINVIRNFQGRGPIVWGARTMNGNSQDYRYVQVRRTLIYVEQSIKAAINQYVFAANVASTWTAVVQMISGFLQNLWSQGGLMGSKASDAFTVACGMPATMTANDVLNGYMIVNVSLQMVHPAEFIELTFTQMMQS
jgi:phage tail sheath protein FI